MSASSGNCQHVHIQPSKGLWTIPLGTHYFFGRTVFINSSSDSVDTSHQSEEDRLVRQLSDGKARTFNDDGSVKTEDGVPVDNLVQDLEGILDEVTQKGKDEHLSYGIWTNVLLEKLVIYIAERDTKVMIHGVNIGQSNVSAQKGA